MQALTIPVSWTCPWCGVKNHGDYYQDALPQCSEEYCQVVLFWSDIFGPEKRARLNMQVRELNETLLSQWKEEATNA